MTSLRSLSRAAVLLLVAFLALLQPAFAGTSIETVNQLIAEGRLTDARTVLRAILVTGTGEEKVTATKMLEQLDGHLQSSRAVIDQHSPGVAGERVESSTGLTLLWVKPGHTGPLEQLYRFSRTQLTINQGYYLAQTEVTQAQWEAVMGDNPTEFKGSDLPVENVSWYDALDFCRKLTEKDRAAGKLPQDFVYTMPSEEQWEYACRAGTTGHYAGLPDAMAWYGENSGVRSRPVGSKKPNAWGFYDMHGNVWEWTYGGARGGSWTSSVEQCASGHRHELSDNHYKTHALGFRPVLEKIVTQDPKDQSHKVNLIILSSQIGEKAIYEDILGSRPAKKEGDPDIPTLKVGPANLLYPLEARGNAEEHQKHFSRITNLTNLDQLSVQDEVARILSEIPCSPNSNPKLVVSVTKQPHRQDYLKITSPWVPWKISFNACLVDEGGKSINRGYVSSACGYPNHGSDQMSDIDYNELIRELKMCRDAIQKQVREDNLLEKWKAATQSNSSTSGSNNP